VAALSNNQRQNSHHQMALISLNSGTRKISQPQAIMIKIAQTLVKYMN
jgi:hypothetical protein